MKTHPPHPLFSKSKITSSFHFSWQKLKANFFIYILCFLFLYSSVGYGQLTPTITLGTTLSIPTDYFGVNGANTWGNPGGW